MVNKCSVAGCKSLYVKDNVKLHRFPLTNAETLPLWITATGREKGWKPCKSSRLCGNHFKESEYIIGHGKGVLKSTAIPTIEYRVNIPRYTKRRFPYSNLYDEAKNKRKAHEQVENDSNIEIVQLDYNDIHKIKKEYQNRTENDKSCDEHEKSYHKIKKKVENTHDNSGNDDNGEELSSYNEIIQNENSKSYICNRENQCYMFTSSFKEGMDLINLTPPEDKSYDELSTMSIDQTEISNFKKIMELQSKKQVCTNDIHSLYFQSLTKKNLLKQEKVGNSFDDDMTKFLTFIEAEMKELYAYRNLYATTKYQIKRLLMKSKLQMAS